MNDDRTAPSLMAGELGILLFLIEYNANMGVNDNDIEKQLEVAFQDFQSNNDSTFAHGLSGFGWFLQHLNTKGFIESEGVENNLLSQIDEIACKAAISHLEKNNHDFLHGGLGNAIYLLERTNSEPKASIYFKDIVDKLIEISFISSSGLFWKDNDLTLNNLDETATIGLAHGMASKITFFSKLIANKVEEEKAKNLLIKSVHFLRSCRFSTNKISVFPLYCVDGKPSGVSRLAWCHGDLGIGVALYQAGIALQDEVIITEAIELCITTTKRKLPAVTDIVDAGLCHGISGVLTMYNIMFENTGLKVFFESAEYWLNELLGRVDKNGLAGLDAWDNVNKKWVKDDGLLNGLAGIGLALLSHKSRGFEWSSCLLLK